MSLRPEEQREVLVGLAKSRAQLEALELRLLAHAEASEATVDSGAANAADWVAIETRQVRRDARSDLKLAARLEQHDTPVGGDGRGPGQHRPGPRHRRGARPVADRRGEFAVTAEQRAAAEAHLVGLAAAPRRQGAAGPGTAPVRGDRS